MPIAAGDTVTAQVTFIFEYADYDPTAERALMYRKLKDIPQNRICRKLQEDQQVFILRTRF